MSADLFGQDEDSRAARPEMLTVSFDHWEGPLDLLLTLARNQKVDLREISILALTQQYLAFIEGARQLKLDSTRDEER